MNSCQDINPDCLRKLLEMSKWGWWKADFRQKVYVCSDYVIRLLGLNSEVLPFEQFRLLIREDYRNKITQEFSSIHIQDIYEQTFPVLTPYGEIWVHSKLGKKETDSDGYSIIAWGSLQCVENPKELEALRISDKFNTHLHHQNNISRSLLSFLQTEDTSEVIHKILQDLLNQYQAGRTYIIEYNWEKQTQTCCYEVNAQGVTSQKKTIYHLPINETPWWTRQIKGYSPILLSRLDELPPEATAEKEFLNMQGIKSLMVVPMVAQDSAWGYMGIDIVDQYRNWSNDDYQWFASLANIISICMSLHRSKIKALKEQEYFKNLYRYMPIGYVRLKLIYDDCNVLQDYQFVDINPAFEAIIGVKLEKYLGKKAREVDIPFDIDQQLRELEKVVEHPSYMQTNFNAMSKNLYLRCISYTADNNEIVSLFSDITDIHIAHEALDRSEKALRNIYKNIPVGIEIYDKHGYLKDINDKDMEIFGLNRKETALGVNLFENPNIPEEVKQKIRLQENVDFRIKYDFIKVQNYYQSKEQGVKDLIVKASPLYNSKNELENYMLIIIDNTATSSAYSRIQDFENFFSVIADFAKVGYIKYNIYTKQGFALNQWMKNWGEAENTPLEDVVGIYQKAHPDDRHKIEKLYQELINGKIKGKKEEVRVENGRGGWKWIRSTVIATEYDPEHQNVELIGVNFDITELKEIEAKLLEAKNKAEASDRLKSAFLANISHEIRTPLNAIVGFSNLLTDTREIEEQQQYISIIQENNDLLLQMISDILDLSKIEAGTFDIQYTDVNVNILCQEIVDSFQSKAYPGVRLELDLHHAECHMEGDAERMTQIIVHFINNAIKFTSHGVICLGYTVYGNEIKFFVSDTGIGIPSEKLESIFERFVKLNNFIHGTGLGLSVCKSMVEQMGGRIGVDSKEGEGSCFWFTLPLKT